MIFLPLNFELGQLSVNAIRNALIGASGVESIVTVRLRSDQCTSRHMEVQQSRNIGGKWPRTFHRLSMPIILPSKSVARERNSKYFFGMIEPRIPSPAWKFSHIFMAAATVGLSIIKCQII